MDDQDIDKPITNVIKSFLELYKKYPNIFLTEEDVRCFLYSQFLREIPLLSKIKPTYDNSSSISLHTEIRWYGIDGKLKKRSDIVFIDPNSIKTRNQGNIKIHSKGFSFSDYYAIIEIKIRRINGTSDKEYLKLISKDIEKLKDLVIEGARFNNFQNPNYYLICLDKKNDIRQLVYSRVNSDEQNVKLYYAFSQ